MKTQIIEFGTNQKFCVSNWNWSNKLTNPNDATCFSSYSLDQVNYFGPIKYYLFGLKCKPWISKYFPSTLRALWDDYELSLVVNTKKKLFSLTIIKPGS